MARFKEKESCNCRMETSMKEISKTPNMMEMEFSNHKMVFNSRVIIKTVSNLVKGKLSTRMVILFRALSRTIFKMDLVSLNQRTDQNMKETSLITRNVGKVSTLIPQEMFSREISTIMK